MSGSRVAGRAVPAIRSQTRLREYARTSVKIAVSDGSHAPLRLSIVGVIGRGIRKGFSIPVAGELEFLAQHPEIGIHTAGEEYPRGIEAAAQEVVAQLSDVDAICFALDIDGLHPACAPGTGTPEGGGLSTRERSELLRVLFGRLPIRALDIVELAPLIDPADVASIAAVKVIYKILGWTKQ